MEFLGSRCERVRLESADVFQWALEELRDDEDFMREALQVPPVAPRLRKTVESSTAAQKP